MWLVAEFRESGLAYRVSNCPLHRRLMTMVPVLVTGPLVHQPVLLREDPLPAPLGRYLRVLARRSIRQLDAPVSVGQVLLVRYCHAPWVSMQGLFDDLDWWHWWLAHQCGCRSTCAPRL